MTRAALLPVMVAALLLAGCGGRGTDDSGATPSEARQLNEAAAALDNDSISVDANMTDQEP